MMETNVIHKHHDTFPYIEDETMRDAVRSSKRRLLFQQGSELIQLCGGHVVLIYADEDENTTTYTNRDDLWQLLVSSGLRIKEEWSGKLCKRNDEMDSCLEIKTLTEESSMQSEQKNNHQGLLPFMKAAVSDTWAEVVSTPSLFSTTIFTDDDIAPKSETEFPDFDRYQLNESEVNDEATDKDDLSLDGDDPGVGEETKSPDTENGDLSLDGVDADLGEGRKSPDIYEMSTSDYDSEDNSEEKEDEEWMPQEYETDGQPYASSSRRLNLENLECPICDMKFCDAKEMKAHVMGFDKNSFRCQFCLKCYCSETMRDEHEKQCFQDMTEDIQMKPKRRKSVNCMNCGIPWKNHKIKGDASKKGKVQCCMCERQLCDTSGLHLHMKKHFQIKEYLCSTCGSAHYTKKMLQMHETEHDKSQCTCPDCGKVLKNMASLNSHIRFNHTENIKVKCPHCGEVFTSRSDLYIHRKHVHEKEFLRYACEVCGKQFSNPSKVKRHSIIHSGEKPHKCPICGRGFPQADYVKHHAKSVHGVDITKMS